MQKKPPLPKAFAELGVSPPLLKSLAKIGFHEPSEIQHELIPRILEGHDVIGQARTGTGKTAAFGLPILQLADPEKRLQALILVPTRELAVQVTAEMRRMTSNRELHIVPVYGGQKIRHQLNLLGRKPHVVVGTPGRVIDFIERGVLHFEEIRFVVLDEVDRMLDIGFRDAIRTILSKVTVEHQTVFVSATMNDEIRKLAGRYTNNPQEVNVSKDDLTVDRVEQTYVTVDPWDKVRLMLLLLRSEELKLIIVFCNTKHAARRLAKRLHGEGIDVKEIHGDLVQQKRERVMERFRKHRIRVLVATDLAARGIDVQGITHIINYDMPGDPHVYVHRIGRTARMGSFGRAISLVTPEQGKELTAVESLINKEIPEEQVEGFTRRPPREEGRHGERRETRETDETAEPAGVASGGFGAGVYDDKSGSSGTPRKLGAKFKPSRRRRR
jgi:ATP-dependent RNA helicase DeaD